MTLPGDLFADNSPEDVISWVAVNVSGNQTSHHLVYLKFRF